MFTRVKVSFVMILSAETVLLKSVLSSAVVYMHQSVEVRLSCQEQKQRWRIHFSLHRQLRSGSAFGIQTAPRCARILFLHHNQATDVLQTQQVPSTLVICDYLLGPQLSYRMKQLAAFFLGHFMFTSRSITAVSPLRFCPNSSLVNTVVSWFFFSLIESSSSCATMTKSYTAAQNPYAVDVFLRLIPFSCDFTDGGLGRFRFLQLVLPHMWHSEMFYPVFTGWIHF